MCFASRLIKQIVLTIGLGLLLAGCGVDSNKVEDTPGFGSALVQLPLEDRRIAIVHSQTSKNNFYDPFAYNQLFASMQHQAMMAGLPFDLLDETQLAGGVDLLDYEVIVIPQFSHVKAADRAAIVARLLEAQQSGVGIVASGAFLGQKPDGTSYSDFNSAMVSVLGVQPTEYLNGVAASIKVANNTHPVTKPYQADEELVSYQQIWFGHFVPASGEQSTPLSVIESSGATYTGAQIIERDGRVVHFANDQIMADNNLLWRVLQWVAYGDVAPIALQVSRAENMFIARNDMDQAMIAADLDRTEIPLLDILNEWKRDFNFVGSYYIDIGNDPANGQYTDWGVSGPLYRDYISMGNEIATHSWTHPHYTRNLTAAELEFEFKDSAAEIGTQVGEPVIGAAVPGTSETLEVVETLNPWLDYLSGRLGTVGSGYPGAIGFLEPQHSMMYFSLNMSPDFTLIDYLNRTPVESTVIWKDEIDGILKHAQQPVVHWLWHDYGPTTQTDAGLYTKEMFTDTIAYAKSKGTEFLTVKDLHQRILDFADVEFSVGSAGVITAAINATGVGQFSLKVTENTKIESVKNWYAYSDDRVFLPDDGGEFVVSVGATPAAVTRITALPMRARLLSLSGNGNVLNFTFEGEGEVSIALSDVMASNTSVTGADSFLEENGLLTLQFNSDATHTVELTPVTPLNQPPVAAGGTVSTESGIAVPVLLTGSDSDNDTLSFTVETNPLHGVLSGSAPNLTYTPDPAYTGADSFSYTVNDGNVSSAPASFAIAVVAAPVINSAPSANELILESQRDQSVVFQLSGSDNENQPLTYQITSMPEHGTLTGATPALIYTPNAGYVGRDSLEFVVNDSIDDSAVGTVVFNVENQLTPVVGTVSNPSSAVAVDGNLAEWAAVTGFGDDPQDVSGANNQLDWKTAMMAHDASNLYIAYQEHGAADLTWGNQIFIDTDSDSSTGFRGFGKEFSIGADYLLESGALFRYTGVVVQDNWLWEYIGSVNAAASGDSAEIEIPRQQLGNPENMLLFFYGNSAATAGTSIDYFPDNAADPATVLRSRYFSYSVNPNNAPNNFAPVAFAQQIRISEGTSYPLTLTGFDQDGDLLDYTIGQQPGSGTLTGTAPDLVYTPNAGTTQDLITYSVSDGTASSDFRSIQFFVVSAPTVNTRPSASNKMVEVIVGTSSPISLTGTDADGDNLTYRVVNPTVYGELSGSGAVLTYAAPSGTGVDSFTYVVNDGQVDSSPATVMINLSTQLPANTAPLAQSQNLTTGYETALGINLTAVDDDNDPLTYNVLTQPALGLLSGTAPQLTYVPYANSVGIDSFTFTVNDGTTNAATATVSIEVQAPVPVNEAPVANGQSLSGNFSEALNITLTGRDPEQAALGFQVLTQPQGGVLSGTAPNLVYTPGANFSGADSFTFKVNDGELDSASATVTIDVGSPPDGSVSNPVTSLSVDGSLSDWSGLQSLGADPADVYGVNNPLDWRQAWVAHSATDLFIAYRNHEAFTLSWGHGIYVDTDGDINTGFRGFYGEFPIGADILIETDDVQSYTGTGSDWAWATSGQAMVATDGEIGELSVPLSTLSNGQGSPQSLRFYFRADNSAFGGNTVDHFPDAANDASADQADRSLPYRLVP